MARAVLLASAIAIEASGGAASAAPLAAVCNTGRPANPAAALKILLDGNVRWASGAPRRPGQELDRRECVFKNGQTPFAAILSCSDSRVPTEILFDQGLGDLFVVRIAGNSADTMGAESLQYAVDVLGAPLIVVLGHQSCGAVLAAASSYPKPAPKFVQAIYDVIPKARESIKSSGGNPHDTNLLAARAIDAHVIHQVQELRKSAMFREKVASGKLRIVGGRYDLESGRVTMLIE